jgi:hypothetical protein
MKVCVVACSQTKRKEIRSIPPHLEQLLAILRKFGGKQWRVILHAYDYMYAYKTHKENFLRKVCGV